MTALTFQQAKLKDLKTIVSIEIKCFQQESFHEKQLRYLLETAKGKTYLVFWHNQAAGYGTLLLPAHPRPARLYSLATLPNYRGKGIAKALTKHLIHYAKKEGYTRIRLETNCHNHTAIKLYHGLGFSDIALLPAYYENGDDAIRMERTTMV